MREETAPRGGVASVIAHLEKQAQSSNRHTPTTTPQKNSQTNSDSEDSLESDSQKSGSPLTRSESIGKKLSGKLLKRSHSESPRNSDVVKIVRAFSESPAKTTNSLERKNSPSCSDGRGDSVNSTSLERNLNNSDSLGRNKTSNFQFSNDATVSALNSVSLVRSTNSPTGTDSLGRNKSSKYQSLGESSSDGRNSSPINSITFVRSTPNNSDSLGRNPTYNYSFGKNSSDNLPSDGSSLNSTSLVRNCNSPTNSNSLGKTRHSPYDNISNHKRIATSPVDSFEGQRSPNSTESHGKNTKSSSPIYSASFEREKSPKHSDKSIINSDTFERPKSLKNKNSFLENPNEHSPISYSPENTEYQHNLEQSKRLNESLSKLPPKVPETRGTSKVTVIAAKLKQNATIFNDQEVDALCFNLMSNLQEAIQQNGDLINLPQRLNKNNEKHPNQSKIYEPQIDDSDFSYVEVDERHFSLISDSSQLDKSTHSEFSYIDANDYENQNQNKNEYKGRKLNFSTEQHSYYGEETDNQRRIQTGPNYEDRDYENIDFSENYIEEKENYQNQLENSKYDNEKSRHEEYELRKKFDIESRELDHSRLVPNEKFEQLNDKKKHKNYQLEKEFTENVGEKRELDNSRLSSNDKARHRKKEDIERGREIDNFRFSFDDKHRHNTIEEESFYEESNKDIENPRLSSNEKHYNKIGEELIYKKGNWEDNARFSSSDKLTDTRYTEVKKEELHNSKPQTYQPYSSSGFSYFDQPQTVASGFSFTKGYPEVILRTFSHSREGENRNSSSTTESAYSEEIESGSSEEDTDSDTDSESSEERVHVVNEGLETITEEDRPPSTVSRRSKQGESSSPDDESTLKDNGWSAGTASNHESTSDLSTSSSGKPRNLQDSSTRCNEDFQWIRKTPPNSPKMEEPHHNSRPPINRQIRDRTPRRHSDKPAPGSLDRRRHHHQNRHERDQKSRSSHVPKDICQNSCCNPNFEISYESLNKRHERLDPQRYGSNSMLLGERYDCLGRGSHPELCPELRYRHEMSCCAYHTPPPCCRWGDVRSYHWSPSKPPDDERIRRLQNEKDSLQLQVAVLNDQIEAQSEKITELERLLTEKKQLLGNAEDMLQRVRVIATFVALYIDKQKEMLSRSSLETQKLELMSAMSELKLQQAALERENVELRSSQFNNNSGLIGVKKPPMKPRLSPQPSHTSTPVHHLSNQMLSTALSPSPSPLSVSNLSAINQRRIEVTTPVQQEPQPPKTPPSTYKRQIDMHYGSLPRQQFVSNGGPMTTVDSNANPANGTRKGVAFAEAEKILIDTPDSTTSPQPSPSLQSNKNRGIKKIFGRMKRSGSGNLEDFSGDGEFKRGGIRATASARLGWSENQNQIAKPEAPFVEWDTETICTWLQELGMDAYITEAKRWIKNGAHLQSASTHDLEKELGLKNVLHRKKLQLALLDMQEGGSGDPYLSAAGELDTAWVLRWLDDTGLPQHKETFLTNRIDGRMLHRLTMDDLAVLHITTVLQVASLKRGIQVLREHNFDPSCLQRRSLPEDPSQPTPQQVSVWTTHRVMEWLRAVDLAEYAPNLRGAGVHGGLMVLEPRFTAELLATLLSIPSTKTLLRRHLNTHFKELLGRDVIQEKREAETTLGYVPITPAAKIKVTKKSQFSLKKKKEKGEMDYGDLVCPLNPSNQSGDTNGTSSSRDSVGMKKTSVAKGEVVSHPKDDIIRDDISTSTSSSPISQRQHQYN